LKYEIRNKPSFAAIFVTLNPGDSITAEAGAMTSMDGKIAIKTEFSGGFISGLVKSFLGGESLFVNVFTNQDSKPQTVVLTQSCIGDIEAFDLNNSEIHLQRGAYIAHTPGVNIGVRWAGFSSLFAGEGLFKLKLSGQGKVFFGAYGGITKKRVNGEFVVDTSHLVAYSPNIKMNIKLAGGLFGSVTSGEGLVSRLSGDGDIYLQSRSVNSLVGFLSSKIK
jgi:uncharacterized protein (TIGR00266 family)